MTSHAIARLHASRDLQSLLLIGTAASRFQVASIPADLHARTLVVHGEQDDTVPLADVLDWARPQSLPVTVVPGVEHFSMGNCPCSSPWCCDTWEPPSPASPRSSRSHC